MFQGRVTIVISEMGFLKLPLLILTRHTEVRRMFALLETSRIMGPPYLTSLDRPDKTKYKFGT